MRLLHTDETWFIKTNVFGFYSVISGSFSASFLRESYTVYIIYRFLYID